MQFRLRAQAATCTLCPLFNVRGNLVPVSLQVFRGEFGPPTFDTRANYNAGFVSYRTRRFQARKPGGPAETPGHSPF